MDERAYTVDVGIAGQRWGSGFLGVRCGAP